MNAIQKITQGSFHCGLEKKVVRCEADWTVVLDNSGGSKLVRDFVSEETRLAETFGILASAI